MRPRGALPPMETRLEAGAGLPLLGGQAVPGNKLISCCHCYVYQLYTLCGQMPLFLQGPLQRQKHRAMIAQL